MSDFTMRVVNARPGVGKALMFFDIDFGYETPEGKFVGMLTAKGFVFKTSNEGKPFFQGPAKLRTRNGVAVKNERGFDQYDEYVVLYGERGGNPKEPEKFGITDGGWAARRIILQQAETAYARISRTSTVEKAPTETKEYAAGVGSTERGSPTGGDTDSDLPF